MNEASRASALLLRLQLQAALVCLLACPALQAAPAVSAQASSKVVVVRFSNQAVHRDVERAFRDAFGGQVHTLTRDTEVAAELQQARAEGVGAIVAIGGDAAERVTEARIGLPVLVALAPPLPGVTALVGMHASPVRQVRALRQALPKARRVGLIFNPAESRVLAREYVAAAEAEGLTVSQAEVGQPHRLAPLARALMGRVDVLWLLPDSTAVSAESFKFLVKYSFEVKVPLVGFSEGMCRAGALLALEVAPQEMGQRAASTVQRMLSTGVPAVDPNEGTLCVNARAAGLLQVSLPDALLAKAGRVIQE